MAPRTKLHEKYRLSTTEWAYIAGFLDGEGCISPRLHPDRNPQIRLTASQVDIAPLLYIQSRLGGQIAQRDYGYGTAYVWRLTSRYAVKDALRQLYPYLIVKRRRAAVAYKILQLGKGDPRVIKLSMKLAVLNAKRTKRYNQHTQQTEDGNQG